MAKSVTRGSTSPPASQTPHASSGSGRLLVGLGLETLKEGEARRADVWMPDRARAPGSRMRPEPASPAGAASNRAEPTTVHGGGRPARGPMEPGVHLPGRVRALQDRLEEVARPRSSEAPRAPPRHSPAPAPVRARRASSRGSPGSRRPARSLRRAVAGGRVDASYQVVDDHTFTASDAGRTSTAPTRSCTGSTVTGLPSTYSRTMHSSSRRGSRSIPHGPPEWPASSADA